MRLQDKVAIVTGGAAGMGAATARLFAREGARVLVADILDEEGKAVAASISSNAGQARYQHLDVTSEKDWQAAVDAALSSYGRLDILVNNAGVSGSHPDRLSLDVWDTQMNVNAKGAFLMSRAAVPHMRKAKWGRIVSVSSKAAFRPGARRATYAASKAAIVGFTKSLALDLAPFGITVNAVCPGPIRTSRAISTNRREYGDDLETGFRERSKAIPVGRFGEPDEIASMIAYLASEEAAFVTGQAIGVDGGW